MDEARLLRDMLDNDHGPLQKAEPLVRYYLETYRRDADLAEAALTSSTSAKNPYISLVKLIADGGTVDRDKAWVAVGFHLALAGVMSPVSRAIAPVIQDWLANPAASYQLRQPPLRVADEVAVAAQPFSDRVAKLVGLARQLGIKDERLKEICGAELSTIYSWQRGTRKPPLAKHGGILSGIQNEIAAARDKLIEETRQQQ